MRLVFSIQASFCSLSAIPSEGRLKPASLWTLKHKSNHLTWNELDQVRCPTFFEGGTKFWILLQLGATLSVWPIMFGLVGFFTFLFNLGNYVSFKFIICGSYSTCFGLTIPNNHIQGRPWNRYVVQIFFCTNPPPPPPPPLRRRAAFKKCPNYSEANFIKQIPFMFSPSFYLFS